MVILGMLFSAVIIIAVFSVLIIVHELGHFAAARKIGVKVERFAIGLGKKIFGIKRGDTEYQINMIPLGGYVKLAGEEHDGRKGAEDELQSKPVGKRFWVLVAGSLSNYIFAFLILVLLYSFGRTVVTTDIGGVLEGKPAEIAGIEVGDKIISINGEPIRNWEELREAITADKDCLPLDMGIERDGDVIYRTVVPEQLSGKNVFKQIETFVGIGVQHSGKTEFVKTGFNPLKAVTFASEHVLDFTIMTYKGVWYLITGTTPVKGNVGGPIMIVGILAQTIKYGPYVILHFMATISMALAIFNLLPFPILDGGHIMFLGIEKLRRKPLSIKVQEIITQGALVLIVAFILYVSYSDVVGIVSRLKK